jgi:hypothetical protein
VAGVLTLDLTSGEPSRFRVANLMREILAAGKPVKLPSALCKIKAATFAAKIRTTYGGKPTFDVDLVGRTVDFASGAHRAAAAEVVLVEVASATAEAEAARAG